MKLCNFEVGLDKPLFLIAGPCVIESEQMAMQTATQLKEITARLGIPFIYKSSFDKANRSSGASFRGPGMEEGLRILQKVKDEVAVPVLTDVHEDTPMDEVAAVVDVLQTPAFLCRQTNFIIKVAATGKPVNIKKGQIKILWPVSAVFHLVITTWYPICARWQSCVKVTARWFMMVLTLYSYPVARARLPVASVNIYPC